MSITCVRINRTTGVSNHFRKLDARQYSRAQKKPKSRIHLHHFVAINYVGYLAFDIECPQNFESTPLDQFQVCCASTVKSDGERKVWFSASATGRIECESLELMSRRNLGNDEQSRAGISGELFA
jgi:hypothetical protein